MTPEQLQGWLQVGLGGLMLAALFLGYRRIWVFGWQWDALVKDRDEWKALALGRLTTDANIAQAARQALFTPESAKDGAKVVREAGRRE